LDVQISIAHKVVISEASQAVIEAEVIKAMKQVAELCCLHSA